MDFYTGIMLLFVGIFIGFTGACLLTFVGIKRGWITTLK